MNGGGKWGVLILIGTPAALMAMVVFLVLFGFGSGSAAASCGSMKGGSVDVDAAAAHAPIDGYSGDQLKNAAYIMNAAEALGLSQQGQVIGVMTAMGESSLQVLDRGDTAGPDSRGLFQQRGNGAWGFLRGPHGPDHQRHELLQGAAEGRRLGDAGTDHRDPPRPDQPGPVPLPPVPVRRAGRRHAALRRFHRLERVPGPSGSATPAAPHPQTDAPPAARSYR